MKILKNSTTCQICDNGYHDDYVKVKDYCHITEKYRSPGHKSYNINFK